MKEKRNKRDREIKHFTIWKSHGNALLNIIPRYKKINKQINIENYFIKTVGKA